MAWCCCVLRQYFSNCNGFDGTIWDNVDEMVHRMLNRVIGEEERDLT